MLVDEAWTQGMVEGRVERLATDVFGIGDTVPVGWT